LVEAALARLEAVEPTLKAWVFVDRAGALTRARILSDEARAGTFRGPLHGIPAGVKDIFHVEGMVTTAGAGSFAHVRATEDAASVARLRRAGAIILGKTTTTEFAYLDPTPTTNPWNPEHTPGGSSAGSAAAVGARTIPLALGSQTIGSTLRPAAYCGIVGFKPTHGAIAADGVHPLAPSLDHVGIFCRSVDDAALAFSVLAGDATRGRAAGPSAPPRIGLLNGFFSSLTDGQTASMIVRITSMVETAGAVISDVSLPSSFSGVIEATHLTVEAEAAAVHAPRFAEHGRHYRPKIRALIERGQQRTASAYAQALELRGRFRADMERVLAAVDVLMMPTTPAPAPRGLDSTGDPRFCAPWSFAGLPAISLPSGLTPEGLPLGIQLVGGRGEETTLLAVARWCERVIGFNATLRLEGLVES
jgi:aspartyl-tRNA(Asn)/glutamyl-tRNA(Gln) amidotransferase subunit A